MKNKLTGTVEPTVKPMANEVKEGVGGKENEIDVKINQIVELLICPGCRFADCSKERVVCNRIGNYCSPWFIGMERIQSLITRERERAAREERCKEIDDVITILTNYTVRNVCGEPFKIGEAIEKIAKLKEVEGK